MDDLGIIIKKLKSDALNYHTLREQLLTYLSDRQVTIKNSQNKTEYDYCEEIGRLKELAGIVDFLEKTGVFTSEETNETNQEN